jgi:hypothetical protein
MPKLTPPNPNAPLFGTVPLNSPMTLDTSDVIDRRNQGPVAQYVGNLLQGVENYGHDVKTSFPDLATVIARAKAQYNTKIPGTQ